MPVATVDTKGVRKELKSLPGAFVVLRKMSYGERLKSRDVAAEAAAVEGPDGKPEMTMMISQLKVQCFEFATCITEHNLQDANEKLLDFRDKNHVKALDTKVAGEIERLINEMNMPEDDKGEEDNPLAVASGQPSTPEAEKDSTATEKSTSS